MEVYCRCALSQHCCVSSTKFSQVGTVKLASEQMTAGTESVFVPYLCNFTEFSNYFWKTEI